MQYRIIAAVDLDVPLDDLPEAQKVLEKACERLRSMYNTKEVLVGSKPYKKPLPSSVEMLTFRSKKYNPETGKPEENIYAV